VRREFRDRCEKWGGNGVKNLMELSHPSLSSQLCFAKYLLMRRAYFTDNPGTGIILEFLRFRVYIFGYCFPIMKL